MNPATWPVWWDMLCAAVAGFVVGVLVTAKIAITAIRAGKGGTIAGHENLANAPRAPEVLADPQAPRREDGKD